MSMTKGVEWGDKKDGSGDAPSLIAKINGGFMGEELPELGGGLSYIAHIDLSESQLLGRILDKIDLLYGAPGEVEMPVIRAEVDVTSLNLNKSVFVYQTEDLDNRLDGERTGDSPETLVRDVGWDSYDSSLGSARPYGTVQMTSTELSDLATQVGGVGCIEKVEIDKDGIHLHGQIPLEGETARFASEYIKTEDLLRIRLWDCTDADYPVVFGQLLKRDLAGALTVIENGLVSDDGKPHQGRDRRGLLGVDSLLPLFTSEDPDIRERVVSVIGAADAQEPKLGGGHMIRGMGEPGGATGAPTSASDSRPSVTKKRSR